MKRFEHAFLHLPAKCALNVKDKIPSRRMTAIIAMAPSKIIPVLQLTATADVQEQHVDQFTEPDRHAAASYAAASAG